MKYGFIKTACATPTVKVADCKYNGEQIINMIQEASKSGASLVVFPELSVTGYTCGDLFLQRTLLLSAEDALRRIIDDTKSLDIVAVVSLPVAVDESLYNCAAVICHGKLLGLVPKSNIPTYSEFYEYRHFSAGDSVDRQVSFASQNCPISSSLIFSCEKMPEFKLGVEICEDLWVASSPGVKLAQSGATVIANPSASDEVIGKPQYRKELVKIQSAKLCCAYAFCNCGFGESTTDLVFSAHNLICENGTVISESKRFTNGITYADVDLQRIVSERRRVNTFIGNGQGVKEVLFDLPIKTVKLSRTFPKTPFVPSALNDLEQRCQEIITMQASALATRLSATGIKDLVLGVSGGLDSTLALIVCIKALDLMEIPRTKLHCVTMPCFGTTKRTKSNAELISKAYGADFIEIDITNAVRQHFSDIGHDESIHDTTYENSQARERTQVLMDIANKHNGLVIGTGDLSELALGWATYNGDHMAMYSVNCSIPKTLVRYLVDFEKSRSQGELKNALADVLDTPVSPELLPPDENGQIAQKTECVVGPYELHDYFLYFFFRFGFTPEKIFYLACRSFEREYDAKTIKKWLKSFFTRFFNNQFKRSCLPDGPKVGTVSLSPRGDFRMPSDASAHIWLDMIEEL